MTRKIIKIGTSEGVTIPKDVRKKLNLQVGDELEFDFNEEQKKLSFKLSKKKSKKQSEERRKRIANLTTKFIDRYRKDLEALADK